MMDRAAEFLKVAGLRRKLAGVCTDISSKTASDYEKLYQRMSATNQLPEHAQSKSAYYLRRAALVYVSTLQAKAALKARDKAVHGSNEWIAAIAEIERISSIFERYPPDPERKRHASNDPGLRWQDVSRGKPRAESKSKRNGLDALIRRPGWQEALLEHISPIHRNALAVALVTGARPAEIESGVDVQITEQGLLITIKGAKLNEHRGQPTRTLLVSLETPAAKYLATVAADAAVTISTHPKRFSDAVTQAGRRAFPRMRGNISPYSLRHAVASELKASGIDSDGIAQVLGHRATRSQQAYGRACHGKQRTSILGVRASLPIRQTGSDPAAIRRRHSPSPRLR